MSVEEALDRSARCLLAVRGPRGPVVSPMAFWYDGASAWMSTPADSVKITALTRDPACALWIPPAGQDAPGAVIRGRARIFSLRDPRGLALHAPTIAGAMSVLAARNATSILGYAVDVARVPARFLPQNRVVVRVRVEEAGEAPLPALGHGVAPALPKVVPPDVRRALVGERRVVVAVDADGELRVVPAVWGIGFSLGLAPGESLPVGAPAVASLDNDGRFRPTEVAGLALAGAVAAGPVLQPRRVTWWRGFAVQTADVSPPRPPTAVGSVVLPD